MENITDALGGILTGDLRRLVLSKPRSKETQYRKTVLTPSAKGFLVEQFTDTQAFHRTIPAGELAAFCAQLLTSDYLQLNAWNATHEQSLLISRSGRVTVGKKSLGATPPPAAPGHNRKKNYLLPEGVAIPPLVDMGVLTGEGRVVQSMYDKWRQINRFIEMIDDALRDKKITRLNIIDFGCGKSYLTFVLYYYLTQQRGIAVQMVGLDLKADVIAKCSETARRYGYDGLRFQLGEISGYQCDFPVDMVITLHACDTATDYALFHAIEWNASMIFSVPCCQHELNGQMASDSLAILSRYGIVRERVAALMTDAIRGNLLEACGYKTQLLEFVDLSHTPKNILIRALRGAVPAAQKHKALAEVERLVEEFGLEPTLYRLLKERLQGIN